MHLPDARQEDLTLKGLERGREMQKLSVSLNSGGSEQKSPALPGVPDR